MLVLGTSGHAAAQAGQQDHRRRGSLHGFSLRAQSGFRTAGCLSDILGLLRRRTFAKSGKAYPVDTAGKPGAAKIGVDLRAQRQRTPETGLAASR
jgi:hypothetical protein